MSVPYTGVNSDSSLFNRAKLSKPILAVRDTIRGKQALHKRENLWPGRPRSRAPQVFDPNPAFTALRQSVQLAA